MSRKTLIRSTEFPYHVTARGNNREPFHCNPSLTWKILNDHCFEVGLLFNAQVHALVLMENHFHMLITCPSEDLGFIMTHFMRSLTKTLNRNSSRSGRAFGGRYHWTLVDSPIYFAHAFKYIYRNPVRAGVCKKVEAYQYSTLSGLIGERHLPFPLFYPFDLSKHSQVPNGMNEMLTWLNQPFRKEHEEAIQKGLKKTLFSPPKNGWKRTLEDLKHNLL